MYWDAAVRMHGSLAAAARRLLMALAADEGALGSVTWTNARASNLGTDRGTGR